MQLPESDKTAERKSSQAITNRITSWFAQAGVSKKSDGFERDANKKTERRRIISEQRKLQNLENVMEKALEFCPDSDTAENIDPDWFFSFVTMAEDIYSPTMQEIWGKIFAVEVTTPGTFSTRTLRTLKELTQRDAKMFQAAVSLSSRKKGEYSPKIIYGYYQKPSFIRFLHLNKNRQLNLAEFGLPYPDILSLMDAGLIYNSEIESGELSTRSRTEWRLGNHTIHLSPKRSSLFLNYYKFTPTGAELSKLVATEPGHAYLEKLKTFLSVDFDVV
ncbi:TIGR03899 family protein [Planctobacterium marinum]|uniref:TIGR03899 family protein n=1 Tax=Planctobacterium marinum TaxID=1631968 RepID=A0AA48HJC3_9ALTE|nr:hypothetical protein MACH26_34640 [Planctobacterium marinum]